MKKATRAQTKVHNQRLILRTIYQERFISRADLARATCLTKTTVSTIVSELIAENLVEETGRGPSEGGKPPMLLGVVDGARHLIGLDLANSEFRGAVFDLRGRVLHQISLPLQNENGRLALDLVYELTDALLTAVTSPLLGIGIGSPGLMDAEAGIVRQAVNLDWRDLPLRELLQNRYDTPVYLANDSHAAALGEYTFGPDRGVKNLIVVKVGRGTSAGIVLNGRLHYGDSAGAGEIGHVRVVENGKLCLCGHTGCLETIVSTRVMTEKAQQIFANDPQSALHRFAETEEAVNTDVIMQAFLAGDAEIMRIMDEVAYYLGIAVANLVGALNIQTIIIAGSLARFGRPLIDVISAEMRRSVMASLSDEVNVHLSELGQDVVMLGSMALVLQHELGVV
jgi:glucokinase-like ROK family protein